MGCLTMGLRGNLRESGLRRWTGTNSLNVVVDSTARTKWHGGLSIVVIELSCVNMKEKLSK